MAKVAARTTNFVPEGWTFGIMEASLIVALAAGAASLLTLLSGFGLGTLLLPVFSVFFPLEVAVGLTAVVHVLNNVFKAALLRASADRSMIIRFGVPSMIGSLAGALMLHVVGEFPAVYQGVRTGVTPLALLLALLMLVFAFVELLPRLREFTLGHRHLFAGGLASGFFGGFSGHQGALRSMFLLHSGMGKEAYIATGVMIALMVDLARIPIYLRSIDPAWLSGNRVLLFSGVLAAFGGAWIGKRLIPKVTYSAVRALVGVLMCAIAAALLIGAVG